VPGEGGDSPAEARRRLETLVYPVVLVLACSLPAFQFLPSSRYPPKLAEGWVLEVLGRLNRW
jgi:hypothetical protein